MGHGFRYSAQVSHALLRVRVGFSGAVDVCETWEVPGSEWVEHWGEMYGIMMVNDSDS